MMKNKRALPAKKSAAKKSLPVLSVFTVGASVSAAAYADLASLPSAGLVGHEYRPLPNGCMEHHIDGRLRATVPPEGLKDYAATWPDCKSLADALRAADR